MRLAVCTCTLSAILIAGCASVTGQSSRKLERLGRKSFSDWIYPSLTFFKHGHTTPEAIQAEVDAFCNEYGTNVMTSVLPKGPFYETPFEEVDFEAPTYGPLVAQYYHDLLATNSWIVVRKEQHLLEALNHTGWEWFRVYRKGSMHIRIRIIGVRRVENLVDNPTAVSFDFSGVKAEAVLGENYRLKGTEPYDMYYHVIYDMHYRRYLESGTNRWELYPEPLVPSTGPLPPLMRDP